MFEGDIEAEEVIEMQEKNQGLSHENAHVHKNEIMKAK